MEPYIKDNTGHQKNGINNKINGLFFSANYFDHHGRFPPESYFGNTRLLINVNELLYNKNLYFCDFYCNETSRGCHYVTIVATEPDSLIDLYCKQSLMILPNENPFLQRKNDQPGKRLDYSVWSILEEKACAKPHPNVESLKRALKKAWNEITLETLIKIVDNFPKRLKACMDAKGGHFE
uniref:Phytanoyl-CoA hydroxylase-interacting protein-like C-terminal domain-containing protein n=1 Tax=Acrobeloides nanus TaxID=290746 RepID=A0A914C239_9BILA